MKGFDSFKEFQYTLNKLFFVKK